MAVEVIVVGRGSGKITQWQLPRITMSALFNFSSLIQVILLMICSSTYIHSQWPSLLDRYKDHEALGAFWKMARIGERASPYVSIACILVAFNQFQS